MPPNVATNIVDYTRDLERTALYEVTVRVLNTNRFTSVMQHGKLINCISTVISYRRA